jgi:hypothetical protein
VKTLPLWFGPAIATALWIVIAGFTLSELATVGPALRSARVELSRGREARRPPRTYARVP